MRFLPALLLLAACAAPVNPESTAPPSATDTSATPEGNPIDSAFDANAWMDAAETAETSAEQIALSEALLDAIDWRSACGEDDPTARGRGTIELAHVGEEQSLAAITCQAFDDQSIFALVDARAGRPPRLVRSLVVDADGVPTDEASDSYFGTLSHDRDSAPGQFDVLTTDDDHGGCGLDVRYRLLADGGASVDRVRAHSDCEDALDPADWPTTYSAD